MKITDLLNKLIEKKFYTKEKITDKCNVFFAMSVITEEEYSNLILKIEEVYFVADENKEENIEEVGEE